MNDFEARVIELESRLAFQDDSIELLNQRIVEQQKELDNLTRMVKLLNQQLKNLPDSLKEDERPPHY